MQWCIPCYYCGSLWHWRIFKYSNVTNVFNYKVKSPSIKRIHSFSRWILLPTKPAIIRMISYLFIKSTKCHNEKYFPSSVLSTSWFLASKVFVTAANDCYVGLQNIWLIEYLYYPYFHNCDWRCSFATNCRIILNLHGFITHVT